MEGKENSSYHTGSHFFWLMQALYTTGLPFLAVYWKIFSPNRRIATKVWRKGCFEVWPRCAEKVRQWSCKGSPRISSIATEARIAVPLPLTVPSSTSFLESLIVSNAGNCVLSRVTAEAVVKSRQISRGKVTKIWWVLIPESSWKRGQQYFLRIFVVGRSTTRAYPVKLYQKEVMGFCICVGSHWLPHRNIQLQHGGLGLKTKRALLF